MTTLEEQAKWHEEQAKEHACFHAHHVVKGDDHEKSEEHKDLAARHRASAAVCRELDDKKKTFEIANREKYDEMKWDTYAASLNTVLEANTANALSEIPHA